MIKNKYKISNHYLLSLQPMRCRNFFLIQAGEALCAKDTIIPVHPQKYFEIKDNSLIMQADDVEEEIDLMRKKLVKDHIVRLNSGECRAENSSVFINLVCNLERVGDHIDYIIHSTVE